MISVSDLPLIAIGATVVVYVLGAFLRIPASIIIIGAVIGDFVANRLGFLVPSVSVFNQSLDGLLLFCLPIVILSVLGRKRPVKLSIFDHLLRIVGTFSVILLASKYSYELSSDLADSILGSLTDQTNIYIGVCAITSVLLLVTSLHKVKRSHHK